LQSAWRVGAAKKQFHESVSALTPVGIALAAIKNKALQHLMESSQLLDA
jgi:hypothetical protein